MAVELGISQASYARIESEESKLTVDRLLKITIILETDIAFFLDSSKITIKSKTNNKDAYNNNYLENLYIENKETSQKLIHTLENENHHLKNEIELLQSIIVTHFSKEVMKE